MFPVGLIIMLTSFGSPFLWTTSIFLFLQALILVILIYESVCNFKSVLLVLVLLILSFLVEFLGVKTGFPFGSYSYSDLLQPVVFGVPAAITFAWFSLSFSAYFIAVNLFAKSGTVAVSFIASVLILAADILLEPFASFINGFWYWDTGTIPFQNFLSWLVLGFLFCLLISVILPPEKVRDVKPPLKRIPFLIFTLNILNFLVLDLYHGFYLLSISGTVIIILIAMILPLWDKYEA